MSLLSGSLFEVSFRMFCLCSYIYVSFVTDTIWGSFDVSFFGGFSFRGVFSNTYVTFHVNLMTYLRPLAPHAMHPQTQKYTQTHTNKHTHTHTQTHTHIHTLTHTLTISHAHTHTRTHTHTHIQLRSQLYSRLI